MGCCGGTPKTPDPGQAAAQGIRTDTELQPFSYKINAASALGIPITIGGQTYDFSGQGSADLAAKVSDQMAATLLAIQKEKSPQIIQQRIEELKAADPQGYAARKQLFDRILADAQANPDRPMAEDLQRQVQQELAKGVSFDDARQEAEVKNAVRGGQVKRGVFLGAAPVTQEAAAMVNAGETLRNQRQANAMNLVSSGTSPSDVAYRRMQQSIGNLAAYRSGQSPTAQFAQVSAGGAGPITVPGGMPATNTFSQGAAGQGLSNALDIYSGTMNWKNSQANPWTAGLSVGANTMGVLGQTGFFNTGGGQPTAIDRGTGYAPNGMVVPSYFGP